MTDDRARPEEQEASLPRPSGATMRALRWLFAGATLLLLLPVWGVSRVPTIDGGCHLYNAFVLRHLHDPAYPLFARTFRLDPEPVPNWLIQVLLLPLVSVLPLVTAEKVLLTLYLLLFATTAWIFAGCVERERAPWAFLALPFAWTLLAHYGFYNFLLSVPLALLAVALWWRWRDALLVRLPDARFLLWRRPLVLAALLVVTYFAHLVALVMALWAIGVLWLLDFGRARRSGPALRRWLLHPLLLAPQLLLPLWYLHTHATTTQPNDWALGDRVRYLAELQVLFVFPNDAGPLPGRALALLLAGLAVATLVRERPRTARHHAFVILALVAVVVYLVAPGGVGMGVVLQPRLALFPGLFLLAGISPRLGRRTQVVVAALATLLLAWEMLALMRWHRAAARELDAYLAGLAPLPTSARVLPIVWDRFRDLDTEVLGHASGYALAPRGAVDWDDYQAGTDLFPVRFRPGFAQPKRVETDVEHYDAGLYAPFVDYVYTWGLPPATLLEHHLRPSYRVVAATGAGRLWQRRPGVPVMPP